MEMLRLFSIVETDFVRIPSSVRIVAAARAHKEMHCRASESQAKKFRRLQGLKSLDHINHFISNFWSATGKIPRKGTLQLHSHCQHGRPVRRVSTYLDFENSQHGLLTSFPTGLATSSERLPSPRKSRSMETLRRMRTITMWSRRWQKRQMTSS